LMALALSALRWACTGLKLRSLGIVGVECGNSPARKYGGNG
jgi:hypothetical protein